VSEYGLTSQSTHYRSFRRRVFPVNHLHCNWQSIMTVSRSLVSTGIDRLHHHHHHHHRGF